MLRVTMPYVAAFSLATSATRYTFGTAYTFKLNSLFNPEAGGGHQPYGYDQLCTANGPYTKYKVLGVKFKITYLNRSDSLYPITACTRLVNITDSFALTGSNIAQAGEQPNSRLDVIPATGEQRAIVNSGVPDMSVMFNWSKEQYHADTVASMGAYGTDPSSIVHLDIAIANPFAAAAVSQQFMVEFMFDAVFMERQTLAQS